ncbi:hypothetical protein WA158_004824 [Blastocystis sp. Blastoise]
MCDTVVVIGATGLLGREVYDQLKQSNKFDKVIGTGYSRKNTDIIQLDSTNREELNNFVVKTKPTVIINCAANRYVDKIEKDYAKAHRLNVESVQYLNEICKKENIYLVHVSTDYVFDGINPPYYVNSKPNPLNSYGKLKLESETACLKSAYDSTVVRVPILYGPTSCLSESSVTSLYESIQQKSCSIDHIAIRYPTFTTDVARFMVYLLTIYRHNNEYKGIIHFSANEPFTKYEMCLTMCKLLKRDSSNIHPNTKETIGAQRPKDCHLICNHIVDDQPFSFTYPFWTMIRYVHLPSSYDAEKSLIQISKQQELKTLRTKRRYRKAPKRPFQ